MDQTATSQKEAEGMLYYPGPDVVATAHIKEYEDLYQRSITDPQGFWGECAEELDWFQKWERVLDDSNPPFFKWFTGGKVNIVHNALDRHLKTYRKNKLALIWEGEPGEYAHFLLFLPASRGVQIRQCAAQHGREEGGYRHNLHAAHSGASDRYAGDR